MCGHVWRENKRNFSGFLTSVSTGLRTAGATDRKDQQNKPRRSGEPPSEPAAAAVRGWRPPAETPPSQRVAHYSISVPGVDFGRASSGGAQVRSCVRAPVNMSAVLLVMWACTENTRRCANTRCGRLHSTLRQDKQERETKLRE